MENRNWDDFRYLHQWESRFEGALYTLSEQHLQPGVIVRIHFTYTDVPALQRTYQQILDLAGSSFQYHDTGKGHPSRIRDREKALSNFPRKLENPDEKFIWHALHDFYDQALPPKGKRPLQDGDLGQAEFTAWLHKFTPEQWQMNLKRDFRRLPVSDISIRMPADQFADGQSFLNWVLSLSMLQSPSLFSASAGYCMWYYVGGCSYEAKSKLKRLLNGHPGFYFKTGGWLADSYSPQHNMLKPIIPRTNWLNVLSEDAFLFYPGGKEAMYADAGQRPGLTLHTLQHGFMVQAGAEPGIGGEGRAPELYYDASSLLSLFLKMPSERSDFKEWEQHFMTPEILEQLKEQAGFLENRKL